jgi:hypothetical protein
MAIKLKTGSTNWANLKKVFAKTGTSTWSPVKEVFAKLTTGWQKIWPGNAPAVDENDPIDIRLTSYSGARATSPQYINVKLYGNDGSYTGTTPITKSGRKMRVASDSSGNGTRSVVENSDIFDMSTATATDRFYADGWYLFYELRASNIDGDLDAFSPPIKIIKRVPQFSGVSLDGTVDIGQQLTFSFTAQNFYYNSPDYSNSYVRWWRNTSKVPGGTILKTDYLTQVNRVGTAWGDGYSNSPTSITANSTYNVQSSDVTAGTYVIAELVLVNSYHDHFGGSTGTYISSGDAPVVESVYFRDNNDNDGFDNQALAPYFQPKLPVATPLSLKANISGVTPETTYRVRYRIYNANTGVYWRPFDQVAASSGTAAWQTYTPSVSFSGGSSIITDVFVIDSSTFNGGTYAFAGSNYPTWELEVEVSAVRPGFARVYGDPILQYISYSLGRTSVPSIVATPSTGGSPLLVTFTGQITAFPAGNAYPRAYRINYGDGSAPTSWQTFPTNSANPTYSNTYTYNSQGTFTASIETWPSFTTDSDTVTVISVPNAPTSLTATTNREDGVLLNWNAVSGANYYEIYWQSSQGSGPVNQSSFADFGQDNSITTNSFLDTTISTGSTRYYRVRARSSATASGVNSSNWFPGPGLNAIAGTRLAAATKISTPTNVAASDARTDGINVTWTNVANAATYGVWWGPQPSYDSNPDFGGPNNNGGVSITSTPFLDTGAPVGSRTYYVQAFPSTGSTSFLKSDWSIGDSGTRQEALSKLSTPTGVNATDARTDGVNVTWNTVTGAAYYGVWYGGAPGYDSLADFGGNRNTSLIVHPTNSYLDTSIGSGVTRDYYVQAYRSGDPTGTKSNWGGPDSGTRAAAGTAPSGGSVTLNPSGTQQAGTTITANVSAMSGTATISYTTTIRKKTGSAPTSSTDGTQVASGTGTGNVASHTITAGEASGTPDQFRAFTTGSNSFGSNTVSSNTVISTPAVVSAPATPTGVNTSGSGLVTWSASSGATSYTVEYYTATNSSGANQTGPYYGFPGNSTSFQVTYPVVNSVLQNWARARVLASNSGGSSAYSGFSPASGFA